MIQFVAEFLKDETMKRVQGDTILSHSDLFGIFLRFS